MREVKTRPQPGGDLLMVGKLPPVVRRDRVTLDAHRREQLRERLLDRRRGVALNLLEERQLRFALDHGDDGLPVIVPDDGVGFPVA